MSRIAPLEPPYAPEIQQQFDRIMRGAPPLKLFRVIAGHARAWEKFRAGSLLDPGPLSLREREIVIDRTSARNGCEYEWGVHVALFAGAAELTGEQVRATVLGEADAVDRVIDAAQGGRDQVVDGHEEDQARRRAWSSIDRCERVPRPPCGPPSYASPRSRCRVTARRARR